MDFKKYDGLTNEEVINSRNLYGSNEIEKKKKESFLIKIIKMLKEPMFFLLLLAASVYFLLHEYTDGAIMLVCIVGIFTIELIQERRTDKALEELNKLSQLDIKVIRNGEIKTINSNEVVVNDVIILEEGNKIPADGKILECTSFGVNESALTGESDVVFKRVNDAGDGYFKRNWCYSGTEVTSGMGIIQVTSVGENTEVGKIGTKLDSIKKTLTPLEKQVNKLVIICTIFSSLFFVAVILVTFIANGDMILKNRIIKSLLSGITIAMATIPEEIPVILTVFLAMGAWRLTKKKALVRNNKTIETLGAITVLCTDKTGTLTENKMRVQGIMEKDANLYDAAFLACSSSPVDPMEIAIKEYCNDKIQEKSLSLEKVYEYLFKPETKMVGHIYKNGSKKLLCVKGAYESVLPLCSLDDKERHVIMEKIHEYASYGYRVMAIAKNNNVKEIPKKITDNKLFFVGLMALEDPPRWGIKESIKTCYNAGVRVIMITGDNGETAKGIANNIGLLNGEEVILGKDLEKMSDEELTEKVKTINIFARVYPHHKMRIVEALQRNKEIVAMTGDGVNDAVALKQADVGIAMGQRGTSVAKESADIILLDDNFNTIVDAIENGRTILSNIKKAISYIIAIHIPIALLSLVIPLCGMSPMLMPVHIVLLEALLDPTSSIIFEKVKSNKNIMNEKPRDINKPIISFHTAMRCVMQGILIFLVVFFTYRYYFINNSELAITMGYSVLVLAIMLIAYELISNDLTLTNFAKGLKDKTNLLVNGGILIVLLILIYVPFMNEISLMEPIFFDEWIKIIILAIISVVPFDLIKINIKKKKKY